MSHSIEVHGLGKSYRQYRGPWSRLREWLLPAGGLQHHVKWILRDVSFAVRPGEALGIVGLNGAGKSTLLKMIAGTTRPSEGGVRLSGRVAALLELGIGFHPDFTGRQNVVMAGQLLGYSMRELESMMPEIEAFCEVGDYMDQPVRVYSSGMQMRLAFGVATARRPDVLIVDEALSVGDAYFQHKSFERIRQFQRQGTSLLLVSHDKQAVLSLCDTAIMLHGGGIAMQGAPEAVMDYYNAMLASHQNQRVEQLGAGQGAARTISGTGEAQVTSICLRDESGLAVEVVDVGQKLSLDVHVLVHSALERLVFGYGIKDRLGRVIYGTNTSLKDQVLHDVPAGARYRFDIAFEANLGPGSYSVQTAVVSTETHLVNNYEWRDRALVFTVVNLSREHFDGCAWMDATIDIKTLCD